MMINKTKIVVIIFFLQLSVLSYADVSTAQLSKNPFIKPISINVSTDTRMVTSESNQALSDSDLRATLSSGERSIANVDGVMVFVGEKIKGYELISVDVGSATFVKNGKEIILNVSEMHKKLK